VCLDNTAVITGLTCEMPDSSQEAFAAFQEMAMLASVYIRWVPGHQGIRGNEEADRLAKEGADLPLDGSEKPTLAGVRRLARSKPKELFAEWWRQQLARYPRYERLNFTEATLKCPAELNLPRTVLHRLLAARSGHGDFE